MKSCLEGRNNEFNGSPVSAENFVSMKSGLEGRNNAPPHWRWRGKPPSLNEVRPRRPEQLKYEEILMEAWWSQ